MCAGNELEKFGLVGKELGSVLEKTTGKKSNTNLALKKDLIARFTGYTKVALHHLGTAYGNFQSSRCYRVMHNTTQPAHVVTLLSVIFLTKVLLQDEELGGSSNDEYVQSPPSLFLKCLYLASFAVHLGNQIWMTFVSGLSLYFALPRHTFGDVQKILFPKYFTFNACLSLATLCSFLKCQPDTVVWYAATSVRWQIAVLVVCFIVELFIRLYMTPVLLRLITAKNIMEVEAGVGMEIGEHAAGQLAKCPRYILIHCSFRRVHMTIAIGNMLTMACTAIHLCYLGTRICI